MADEPNHNTPTNRSSEYVDVAPIEPLWRWISLTIGLLAAGLGALAVFATDNSVGATALIVLGIAFLLMAVSGSPISSAKIGGSGIELPLRRIVYEILANAPAETLASATEAIAESSLPSNDPLRSTVKRAAQQRAHEYEIEVLAALQRSGIPVSTEVVYKLTERRRRRLDGVATVHDKAVAIETKAHSQQLGLDSMHQVLEIYFSLPEPKMPILVVTNAPPTKAAMEATKGFPIEVVQWREPTDDPLLIQALERASRTAPPT